jgi:hypothetical protein
MEIWKKILANLEGVCDGKIGVYFQGFFRSRVTLNWMVSQFEKENFDSLEKENFDSLKRKILIV